MNEKLIINTNLLRKESVFRTKSCAVEKSIAGVGYCEIDRYAKKAYETMYGSSIINWTENIKPWYNIKNGKGGKGNVRKNKELHRRI